ncbi:hypothetical protein ACLB2K_029225 [Fragaria x ananassa]
MEKENFVTDHYRVLDLPSEKQITKAYRAKALRLHPDKRPNDPYANAMFQRLSSSYAILKDPKSRKQFDESFQKGLVLTKDQENILFGLGYLIFVAAPMAFPAVRNRRTKLSVVATVPCYHLVFEELHRRQKLEKLWYWMVRVGDYFKRNPRQASVWLPIATGRTKITGIRLYESNL